MSSFWLPSKTYAGVWRPIYQPELYHHGVKGQKWGVRKDRRSYEQGSLVGKRRKLQRELNRTDKQLARDRYEAGRQYQKLSKAIAKNKSQDKKDKIMARFTEHAKNVEKGEAKTKKLLKDVQKSGYTLKERSVRRAMVTGKDVAIMVASAGYLISWTTVPGTKYKVKETKR